MYFKKGLESDLDSVTPKNGSTTDDGLLIKVLIVVLRMNKNTE